MATLVQSPALSTNTVSIGTGGTAINFGSSVTAGSTLVVAVSIGTTGLTINVTDGGSNVYTSAVEKTNYAGSLRIYYKHSAAGGFTSVTASVAAGSGNGVIMAFEVSGVTGSTPTTGTIQNENAALTSHTSSDTPVTGSGFACTASIFGGDRVPTAGSGYTASYAGTFSRWGQYKAGSFTTDAGPYTTATGVEEADVFAFFADVSAAVSVPWLPASFVSQGTRYVFANTGMTPPESA